MLLEELGDFILTEQAKIRTQTQPNNPINEHTDGLRISLQPEHYQEEIHQKVQPEILYMYTGQATILIGEYTVNLHSGNILYIKEQTDFQIAPIHTGSILVRMSLPSKMTIAEGMKQLTDINKTIKQQITAINTQLKKLNFVLFKNKKLDDPAYVCERILCDYYGPPEFRTDSIRAKFTLLCIEILRGNFFVPAKDLTSRKQYTTQDFLKYIDTHYQTNSLNDMALFFHYHPHYLSNKLKKETGKSFMELTQEKKMAVAKELLQNPQLSIDEIIEFVGCSSPSFFYKKFKEFYHVSPKEMRKNLWKKE